MALALANMALANMVDNDEVQDDPSYLVTCDGDSCAALMTEDEYGDRDGLCPTCWAACHFRCTECREEFHEDDRHDTRKGCCVECGCARDQEEKDSLWSELEGIAGEWDGLDDEISKLRKLVAYARKLSR
jgi:hypothetical protein